MSAIDTGAPFSVNAAVQLLSLVSANVVVVTVVFVLVTTTLSIEIWSVPAPVVPFWYAKTKLPEAVTPAGRLITMLASAPVVAFVTEAVVAGPEAPFK